jgi:hypothetical protein
MKEISKKDTKEHQQQLDVKIEMYFDFFQWY